MNKRNLKTYFNRVVKLLESSDLLGVIQIIREVPDLKQFKDGDRSVLSSTLDFDRAYMEALLIEGVDPNVTDTTGATLLMASASLGDIETLRLLLKYGALVNSINLSGESAFSYACARNNLECAKLLYENGADVNLRIGCSGSRPLDWAMTCSSERFVEWMHTVGALRGGT